MKKLIAMLLCFAMVAAFGASAAFAAMPQPNSAAKFASWARNNKNFATTTAAEIIAGLEKVEKWVKAYEAVKYDSSKSTTQVAEAREKLAAQLKKLGEEDPRFAGYPVDTPSSLVATIKANWKTRQAESVLWGDKYDVYTKYYLTSGTKMDYNEYVIGLAKLDAAYDLEKAQESAAKAKAGAIQAQATAKALIADSIKAAQDAAATAVANAQKDAYNTLASNYADAVEAFWAEVENAWF